MTSQTFASVWDAIEDTAAEAESMKMRSALMTRIDETISARGLSQAEAAKLLGGTPAARFRPRARQDRPVQPRHARGYGGQAWPPGRAAGRRQQ